MDCNKLSSRYFIENTVIDYLPDTLFQFWFPYENYKK